MKSWIADAIQIGGFLLVFVGLWLNWRSQRAQTAIAFFSRFDQLVTADKSNLFRFDGRRRRLTSDAMKTARRYFNLCSEEFNLKQHNYIPGDIWEIWRHGIKGILQDQLWRTSWGKMRNEYSSYPKFVQFIDEFAISRPPGHNDR